MIVIQHVDETCVPSHSIPTYSPSFQIPIWSLTPFYFFLNYSYFLYIACSSNCVQSCSIWHLFSFSPSWLSFHIVNTEQGLLYIIPLIIVCCFIVPFFYCSFFHFCFYLYFFLSFRFFSCFSNAFSLTT